MQTGAQLIFIKLRSHEICLDKQCDIFECCGKKKCLHTIEDVHPMLMKSFQDESGVDKLNLLVLSLKGVKDKLSVFAEKEKVFNALKKGLNHQGLRAACEQVLLICGEIGLDSVREIERLQTSDFKHLTETCIIERTKKYLLNQQYSPSLTNASIEILKHGFIPSTLQDIEKLINNPQAHLFAWLSIKNYLAEEFPQWVQNISASVIKTEHSRKRSKDSILGQLKDIEIKDHQRIKHLCLYDSLVQAVNKKEKVSMQFWKGLTGLEVFKGHEETQEVQDFAVFAMFDSAKSLKHMTEVYLKNFKSVNLSKWIGSEDLIDVYYMVAMLPLHVAKLGVNEVCSYVLKIFERVFAGNFQLQSFDQRIVSVKALIENLVKSLLRLASYLSIKSKLKGNQKIELQMGYEISCSFCGEPSEAFCNNCRQRQLPIIIPSCSKETIPFKVLKTLMIEVNCKVWTDCLNLTLDSIFKRSEEIIKEINSRHKCSVIIKSPVYLFNCVILKYKQSIFDVPTNCLTLPLNLISLNYFSYLEDKPLLAKSLVLRLLESKGFESQPNLNIKEMSRIILMPCSNEYLLNLTLQCVGLLRIKYEVSVQDLFNFLGNKYLLSWAEKAADSPGFIQLIFENQKIDFVSLVQKIETKLILKYTCDQVYQILRKFFKEYHNGEIQLYYTGIIVTLSWKNREDKLQVLEQLCLKLLGKSPDEKITLLDILQPPLSDHYENAKIFLLSELGLGKITNDWLISSKFSSTPIIIPASNIEQFFKAYSVLEQVFYNSEYLSQQVNHAQPFSWKKFFELASIIDSIILNEKSYKVNILIGLSKLCFYYGTLWDNLEYLACKIICICAHLLELDIELMLQILGKFVENFDIKRHLVAVLALAFIGRSNLRGSRIIKQVLEGIDDNDLKEMNLCYFMLYHDDINKSGCLSKLKKFLTVAFQDYDKTLFDSLQSAICENFPLIQYAALSIIPNILKSGLKLPYQRITLALNKAASFQSSRDYIGELPFPLGILIDKTSGIVGAYFYSDVVESNQVSDPNSELKTCQNFYSNCERLYLTQILLKSSKSTKESEIKSILQDVFQRPPTTIKQVTWSEVKSLREWTQLLIQLFKMRELNPLIHLIQVNLDIITQVLPKIFNGNLDRMDYFCVYLEEFFEKSVPAHRRLMLNVLDKCSLLYDMLPIGLLLNQHIDLNEFPKALFLIEKTIRLRIKRENVRFRPALINKEELEWCKKIYQGLYQFRYIESIPKICKSDPCEQKTLKKMFRTGFYSHFLLENYNDDLALGAAWRLGYFKKVDLSVNIQKIICYVLGSNDKEKAINEARNLLVRKSSIRTGAFCQAYEHILIQHILENISGISSKTFSYSEIKARNKQIQNKFEYKELALRVNLILYKHEKNTRNFIATISDIIKLSLAYQQFEYSFNFMNELILIHRATSRFSVILRYYQYKLQFCTKQVTQKTKAGLEQLWSFIPANTDSPEELGTYTNIDVKGKVTILYIKILALKGIQDSNEVIKQYLQVIPGLYEAQRLYLEKAFSVLADHFHNFHYFDMEQINPKLIEKVALLYIESLKHGHRLYFNSSTRLLTLFFNLCNKGQESANLESQMIELATNLPLFIWADRIGQIISASSTNSKPGREVLKIILSRLYVRHPYQMMWFLAPYFVSNHFVGNLSRKRLIDEVLNKSKMCSESGFISNIQEFFLSLAKLCKDKGGIPASLLKPKVLMAMPINENFKVCEYDKRINLWGSDSPGFNPSVILIKSFSSKFSILPSKARPLKVAITGSDCVERFFVFKYDKSSDMRKEARMVPILEYINKLFSNNPDCSRMNIHLPTYSITFIGEDCGIVEWVDNTSTVKSLVDSAHKASGEDYYVRNLKLGNNTHQDPEKWKSIQDNIRPGFHQQFINKFPEANDWLRARNTFTRSLAAWSIVGYVVGLGDRHLDNILFKENSAELVFIDFECIFNMGRTLPVPEIVPFRLTPELQTAMGPFFEDGEFMKACEVTLECLKLNKISLMIQFECFIMDPLAYSIYNPEISAKDNNLSNTMRIVKARLDGLKAFNCSEVFESSRAQVRYIVDEATNADRLRVMYFGWAPWY